jgi:hypothetical protein
MLPSALLLSSNDPIGALWRNSVTFLTSIFMKCEFSQLQLTLIEGSSSVDLKYKYVRIGCSGGLTRTS